MGYITTTLNSERRLTYLIAKFPKKDRNPFFYELTPTHPHTQKKTTKPKKKNQNPNQPYTTYALQMKQIMQNTCKTNT